MITATWARQIHKCQTDRVFLLPDPLRTIAPPDMQPFTGLLSHIRNRKEAHWCFRSNGSQQITERIEQIQNVYQQIGEINLTHTHTHTLCWPLCASVWLLQVIISSVIAKLLSPAAGSSRVPALTELSRRSSPGSPGGVGEGRKTSVTGTRV